MNLTIIVNGELTKFEAKPIITSCGTPCCLGQLKYFKCSKCLLRLSRAQWDDKGSSQWRGAEPKG